MIDVMITAFWHTATQLTVVIVPVIALVIVIRFTDHLIFGRSRN